jgi:hypothetical protein
MKRWDFVFAAAFLALATLAALQDIGALGLIMGFVSGSFFTSGVLAWESERGRLR